MKNPALLDIFFVCLFLCDIFSKFNILGGSALNKQGITLNDNAVIHIL